MSRLPAAPANLTAEAGDGQVSLCWMASTDASSYSIYRRPGSGMEGDSRRIQNGLKAESFTDTGLTNGTPFCYVVKACNDCGEESDPSNEASATPQDPVLRRIAEMYDELGEFYERIAPEMGGYAMGARILISRPLVGARVMFIAYQPGQSKGFESDCSCDTSWPDNNEYATCGWPLARAIQAFVGRNVLEGDTVVTNVNFFRAPNKDQWGKVPYLPRRKAEEFSLERVHRLIDTLQPKAIFAIGLDVLDVLVPRSHQEDVHKRKISRVLSRGTLVGRPVVGSLHLTGAQIAHVDRARIGEELKKLLQV